MNKEKLEPIYTRSIHTHVHTHIHTPRIPHRYSRFEQVVHVSPGLLHVEVRRQGDTAHDLKEAREAGDALRGAHRRDI